jgi:hypothetical protein
MSISIVKIEKDKTKEIKNDFYLFYFKLSSEPDRIWHKCFEEKQENLLTNMKRDMWIENDNIVIKCPFNELEKHQIPYLRKLVPQINNCWKKQKEAENKNQIRKEQEKKEKVSLISKEIDRINEEIFD